MFANMICQIQLSIWVTIKTLQTNPNDIYNLLKETLMDLFKYVEYFYPTKPLKDLNRIT